MGCVALGTSMFFNRALWGSTAQSCDGGGRVRIIGTPLWCSWDRGDEVWQDPEDFVGKQNPQAPSLSSAPALEQRLWGQQTSMVLCALPPLMLLFSFLCYPFYPHCPVNNRTSLEHSIKQLLSRNIPLKRNIHQLLFSSSYLQLFPEHLSNIKQ